MAIAKRLVRFLADRAERHGAGGESLDDVLRRFDFVQRNRLGQEFKVEQAAQIRPALALIVHELRKFGERLRIVGFRRMLQLVDRVRIPIVVLALECGSGSLRRNPAAGSAPVHRR